MNTQGTLAKVLWISELQEDMGPVLVFSIFFFQKIRTKEVASEGPSKISHQNYWQELVSL